MTNEEIREIELEFQEDQWECGLACVSMALNCLFGKKENWSVDELKKMIDVPGGVWTIELASLLNRFGAKIDFFSTFLGARPDLQEMQFYEKNFDKEEIRINDLFSKIRSEKLFDVNCSSFDSQKLKELLLTKKAIVLALIDGQKITCKHCLEFLEDADENDFEGHFVLLNGFNPKENSFIYCDPSSNYEFSKPQYCSMIVSDFEKAHISKGTDEDLIIIHFS